MIPENDIPSFFADIQNLSPQEYLFADYVFQCTIDPRLAAAGLACEQSTAQWKRVNVQEDFRKNFGAKVVDLKISSNQCQVKIAHPIINFGPRIPNLLSALAGEGPFYCPGITSLRWMDISFPDSYLKEFSGPQFGVAGLRNLLKVTDRPFFIGVVKPNLGLPPADFATLAYQSWMGGLDIAKDDEMLADAPASPLADRMRETGILRKKAEAESHKPKMMIANITDETEAIPHLYDVATANGANAVMLNVYFTGFGSVRQIRAKSQVPIMTHFTGMAVYDRIPSHGIDGVVLVKLQRMAGADMIGLPGFGPRMKNTDDVVLKNIKACLDPMGDLKPALPIPGGSDWAKTLESVSQKIGHTDFGFIAGRGIYGHPDGPGEGAQSLHQAWDALTQKIPLEDFAKTHHALNIALKTFG